MKVLMCASEGTPFIKTGGLADVIGSLPKSLKAEGQDIRVVLPYYKKIKEKCTAKYLGYAYVRIGESNEYAGIFEEEYEGITFYFIDSDRYFNREALYGYGDDGERFAFFNFAILEMIKVVNFYPDVIHTNDWQTGLVPYILKYNYQGDERFRGIKTVFSIHNIQYQGQFGRDLMNMLFLPYHQSIEYNYGINFMKAAIMESNIIATVSPNYKNEVLTDQYGYGLNNVLGLRYYDFYGILNGLDIEKYNPETDKHIYENYNSRNYKSKKRENKIALLKQFGLDPNPDCPLFGLVSRLADQKGIDLFMPIMDELINYSNAKFIFMGSGERNLENFFKSLESIYPDRFKCYVGYSDDIAQKIYAGSDVFLMPSKFEPCGLGQMIAMRYGTLPLVRETGGLYDTVIPFNKYTGEGNGYTFTNFNSHDLKEVMFLAIHMFNNQNKEFNTMIKNAMKQDFSWNKSAKEYIELYKKIKG